MVTEVRSLTGPPPAQVGRIAHPPTVTIDIGSNGVSGNYVHSVVQIPSGFRDADYAGGLAVAYKYGGDAADWNGDPVNTTGAAYLGLHRRAASTRMGQGWATVGGSYIPAAGWMYLAAQRRGEYIYGVTAGTANATEDINTAFAVRCPTINYSEYRHWQICPVWMNDPDNPMTSGAVHSMWGPAPNFTMHISDHDIPGIWFLQDHQVMYCTDDGTPWTYQWKTEPSVLLSDPSTFVPHYTYDYQMPSYFQAYYNHPYFTLPALVFPWAAGDYGPPEMWWFGMENYQGAFTGRLIIYRSTWNVGNFAAAAGLASSSNNTISTNYNLSGYAFDHQWYNPANIVGIVGPFNIDFNHGFSPTSYVPRVIRSTKNKNALQLALMTNASTLPGGWDGVHLAHSDDDGKHWSHPRQVMPGAAGDQFTTVGPPGSGTLDITMDATGGVWSPIDFTRKGQDAQALANWVRGTGIGNVNARNQNWKRPQGPQWL